jgi:isoamylase
MSGSENTVVDRMWRNTFPIRATVPNGGLNCSVFSENADSGESEAGNAGLFRAVLPDTRKNRTYHSWHVFVPDICPGHICGFLSRLMSHGKF